MGHGRTKYNNLVKTPELETDPEHQGPEMNKDPQQFQGPEIEKKPRILGSSKFKNIQVGSSRREKQINCRIYSKES